MLGARRDDAAVRYLDMRGPALFLPPLFAAEVRGRFFRGILHTAQRGKLRRHQDILAFYRVIDGRGEPLRLYREDSLLAAGTHGRSLEDRFQGLGQGTFFKRRGV
ncbi:hypothetical protein SDC9_127648 [bioreactor metagenome]|uniref:Uncharacterized protein n=1 Tax=bioreactor metagenome TaxID=1076179 RepID=A0A645CUR1_9ZZZZ